MWSMCGNFGKPKTSPSLDISWRVWKLTCPIFLCQSKALFTLCECLVLHIFTFARLSFSNLFSFFLNHVYLPLYGVSLHVCYDTSKLDELYGVSLISNTSHGQQVLFDTKHRENIVNLLYFTTWELYKNTTFSCDYMIFTLYNYHGCS